MLTYPGLTLANICRLFRLVNNYPLKQTELLSLLPKEIVSIFFPYLTNRIITKEDRVTINPLFTRNSYNKMSFEPYIHFKKCCIDKTHQTLNQRFFSELKKSCHDFSNIDVWENLEIKEGQLSKSEYFKELLKSSGKDKTWSPIELLLEMFKWGNQTDTNPNSFINIFFSLYQYYKENPTRDTLETLLAYTVLCSIFPNPETLDGYLIPPALSLDIFDFKTAKSGIFKEHTAIKKIDEILNHSSNCIIIGPHGSGKESLVNAFEVHSNFRFSSFQYYKLAYEKKYTSLKNEISIENLDEILAQIEMKVEHNPLPAVIVLSNWRGKEDIFYNRFLHLKNICIIFLSTNQTIAYALPDNCVDLTNKYIPDRKNCSKKIFLDIYGSGPSTFEEKIKLENLLEKIDFHFFSTIMLAHSMGRKGLSILGKTKEIEKGGKIFEEVDVLKHTRNLGLDDLTNNALQFLRLLCLFPEKEISKSFLSALDLSGKKYIQGYRKCLEASLIQETPDHTFLKVCPHIRLALIGSSSFQIEDETIFPFFMHISKIAETCHNDMFGNEFIEHFTELTDLISFLLKLFPYKSGQFTSAYISLVRFLWLTDHPQSALSYLKHMEKQIINMKCRFFSTDLAQVYLTMGYVYNSIADKEMATKSFINAGKVFIKQQTNAFFLQSLNDYSDLKYNLCLDDLEQLKMFFGSDSEEVFTGRLHVAHLLILKLNDADNQNDRNEIFRAAKYYLDECCSYFENNNIKPALASSLYLRAVLLRNYGTSDFQSIVDDLSRAKQIRASIRGANHSWMIPIYLEEAELYVQMMRKDLVSEAVNQIEKILTNNREINLQKDQYKRLKDLKKSFQII